MTEHRATPRQWSGIERFVRYGAYDSCLIELRDRVEALEAAQRVESNYPEKPHSSNAPESSDLLVEGVANALHYAPHPPANQKIPARLNYLVFPDSWIPLAWRKPPALSRGRGVR